MSTRTMNSSTYWENHKYGFIVGGGLIAFSLLLSLFV